MLNMRSVYIRDTCISRADEKAINDELEAMNYGARAWLRKINGC